MNHDALVACCEQSPAKVGVHDREGWLSIFAEDGGIEDPVGSPPVWRRDGSLGRFWDTFIAPHGIRFEVARDCFLGHDVMRDATIHTTVGPGVVVPVEAYLLYQLVERDGRLQVRRMAAHWQLGRLSLGALALGPRAWLPMTLLFARMLRRMGLLWVGGYLASLWSGIGARGVAAAKELARAIESRDAAALTALFADDAVVELGATPLSPSALLHALPPTSRLAIEAPVSAGWTTSFRFRIDGPAPRAGLALLEFARSSRIARARFFASATTDTE